MNRRNSRTVGVIRSGSPRSFFSTKVRNSSSRSFEGASIQRLTIAFWSTSIP